MAAYSPRGGQRRQAATRPKPRAGRRNLIGRARPQSRGLGTPKPQMPGGGGPKPGLGAPAAAASAAPQGQGFAPDSSYNNRIDTANRQEQSRLGELDKSERSIKHEFGLEDPTNPFSRANALKRAFLARGKSASLQLASRGMLYSGAHERAVSRTRRDEEEARHNLRGAYEDAIGKVGSARAGVKFETEEQRQQAFEDWLARVENEVPGVPEEQAPAEPGPAAPPTRAPGQQTATWGSHAAPVSNVPRPAPKPTGKPGKRVPVKKVKGKVRPKQQAGLGAPKPKPKPKKKKGGR